MQRSVMSKWDQGGRYWLPMSIFRKVSDAVSRRRNAAKIGAVLAYICRAHGTRPDRPFALDRRAIAAALGFGSSGVGTIILDLEALGVVERQEASQGYRIKDGKPRRRPVVWRFTAWVASCLRFMLARSAKYKGQALSPTGEGRESNPERLEPPVHLAGRPFRAPLTAPRISQREIPPEESRDARLEAALARWGKGVMGVGG